MGGEDDGVRGEAGKSVASPEKKHRGERGEAGKHSVASLRSSASAPTSEGPDFFRSPKGESIGPWEASPGAPETAHGSVNSSSTANRTSMGEIIDGATSSDEKGLAAAGLSSVGPFKPLAGDAVMGGIEPRCSVSGEP